MRRHSLATTVPRRRVLLLVENLPVPFDRRMWMQATTLQRNGYQVTVICPRGQYASGREVLHGVTIYRYPLPSLPGHRRSPRGVRDRAGDDVRAHLRRPAAARASTAFRAPTRPICSS